MAATDEPKFVPCSTPGCSNAAATNPVLSRPATPEEDSTFVEKENAFIRELDALIAEYDVKKSKTAESWDDQRRLAQELFQKVMALKVPS